MEEILNVKHIYFDLLEYIQNDEPCVIATVTGTMGSTPQKPGCSAIIGKDGILTGTVGGGVVELKTVSAGMEAVQTKKTGYCSFDLNHGTSEVEDAICGGGMHIFLDAAPEKHLAVFQSMKEAALNRIPGILVTFCIKTTANVCAIERYWLTMENISVEGSKLPVEILNEVEKMLKNLTINDFKEISFADKENEERLVFLESICPMPRLIIAGAGHVGKALSHLGRLLDFEVTVWDDRAQFANKKHLPDAHRILSGDLEEGLGNLLVDNDTYIVIVTHGHKNDADVLRKFIASDAGYVGMIGSRRKIEQVRDTFFKNNWATKQQWDKIHTPIGLEIHSKTIQEIAVSIAAQLILVRNKKGKNDG